MVNIYIHVKSKILDKVSGTALRALKPFYGHKVKFDQDLSGIKIIYSEISETRSAIHVFVAAGLSYKIW